MINFHKFVEWGLCPIPVTPGTKQPALPWRDYQNRLPTKEELDAWSASDYGVGVVCGKISNCFVLDADSQEAIDALVRLNLPVTVKVRTAKGFHLYFSCPPDIEIRNTVRLQNIPLDIRGEGGFVVAPSSIHPTGVRYEWEVSPDDVRIAAMPESLIKLIKPATGRQLQISSRKAELTTVLQGNRFNSIIEDRTNQALAELRASRDGERNNTLNRVSFGLATIVAPTGADWEPIAAELLANARAVGLSEAESTATIASAWEAGASQPAEWIRLACEWVYASNRDQFIEIASKRSLAPKAFNRRFNSLMPKKGRSISTYLTDEALIEMVYDLRLEPAKPAIFEHDGEKWLNTYVPPMIEAVEGDATLFVSFVDHLIPNEAERAHALAWIAHAVRNPGEKIGHALMLRTARQGVGKTTLVNVVRALIGEANTRKASSDELRGQFQSFLGDNLLVCFEEVNLAAGREIYNRSKTMLSDDTVVINEKYVAAREVRNLTNFIFLTNLPNPLLIEPDDRRFFYIDSPAAPRDPEFYKMLSDWWPRSLGVIRHWLDTIDLTKFNPRARPPQTQSHAALGVRSRSILEQELLTLFRYREWPFVRDIVTLDEVRRAVAPLGNVRTSTQLIEGLKAIGAENVGQHRTGGRWHNFHGRPTFLDDKDDRPSLWIIDNVSYWQELGPSERVEEYRREEGLMYPVFLDAEFWRQPLGALTIQ